MAADEGSGGTGNSGARHARLPDSGSGKSGKRARRSGTNKRSKSVYLRTRVEPELKAFVYAAAEGFGVRPSEFMRAELAKARLPPPRAVLTAEQTAALVQALGLLHPVANNLNQLARLGNSGGTVWASAVETELAGLRAVMNELRAALGVSR
jgi:hypothetical protein